MDRSVPPPNNPDSEPGDDMAQGSGGARAGGEPGGNHMLARMRAGAVAYGVGLRQARTVDTGRLLKTAGCDWLFIDTEHNAMDLGVATALAVAGQDAGVTPIVRVPHGDYALANRMLDNGAMGIVMPHVDSAAQAAGFARACRYPPLGRRSVAAGLPQVNFAPMPLADAVARIESQVLLFAMVETPAAASAAAAIAATTGIDGILLGLTDLSMELGVPGQVGHPSVRAVARDTAAACRQAGKWVGLGGVNDLAILREYLGWGMHFAIVGSDLGLLMAAVSSRIQSLAGDGRSA
jgi:2-keto-3-deoxy-L-rhamnonate aldolase RhmA